MPLYIYKGTGGGGVMVCVWCFLGTL